MSKLAQVAALSTALATGAAAQQERNPLDTGGLPPADAGHVLKVDRPAYLLAQATPTSNPGFTITTIQPGELNAQQKQEFTAMQARIHNAHVDSFIQSSRATHLKEIDGTWQSRGEQAGKRKLTSYYFGAKENKVRQDEDGELQGAKAKEAAFKAEINDRTKYPTILAQYEFLKKYLTGLDAATKQTEVANDALIAKTATYMKPAEQKKLAEALADAATSQRAVYNEAPKGKK